MSPPKLRVVSEKESAAGRASKEQASAKRGNVINIGMAKVLEDALEDVYAGRTVGISLISFREDWSFRLSSSGSVLRVPGFGIAAAHMLAADMEQRLRGLVKS